MTITTENKEKYEEEIKKYFSNKKRWDSLKNAVGVLSRLTIVCLITLYAILGAFLIVKLTNGNTNIFKKLSIILFIIFCTLFILTVTIEYFNFSMSTRAKLWNLYITNCNEGYALHDINLWFDSDKIYSHLIFKKESGESRIAFMRLDEFLVDYKDVKEPEINLDNFCITMPEKDKNEKNIVWE